jgi:hypothetical protein
MLRGAGEDEQAGRLRSQGQERVSCPWAILAEAKSAAVH